MIKSLLSFLPPAPASCLLVFSSLHSPSRANFHIIGSVLGQQAFQVRLVARTAVCHGSDFVDGFGDPPEMKLLLDAREFTCLHLLPAADRPEARIHIQKNAAILC